MGIWNHIDFELLNDIDDMITYGILDEEEDAEIVTALKAVADIGDPTPEQQALVDKHYNTLMARLDENRESEELEYRLSKDD